MVDWGWSQSAIQWNSDGSQVAVMLEAFDNKDRWLTTVDLKDAGLTTEHRLQDEAWINYTHNEFGWLNNSNQLYFLSEETGHSQLYIKSPGQEKRALTSGKYLVSSVYVTQDDKFAYFKANKKHPGIYETYRVNIVDSKLEQLTDLNGVTDFVLSPDESKLLLTHSKLDRPPELYIKELGGDAAVKITDTISDEFKAINWVKPQIVPVPSSNTEQPIYSRVYLPQNYAEGEKRRAVVFSHGAGYLQKRSPRLVWLLQRVYVP